MPSFGENLKRLREQRGITLDEVSLTTKIGTRLLRALEEEKFDQLPGGIFNKGFVRAYARYLKIDEEQAVAEYLEAAGDAAPSAPLRRSEPSRAEASRSAVYSETELSFRPGPYSEQPHGSRTPWAVAGVLLALALGFSAWNYYKREMRSPVPSPSASTAVPNPTPPSAAVPGPNAAGSGAESSNAAASAADGSTPAVPAPNPAAAVAGQSGAPAQAPAARDGGAATSTPSAAPAAAGFSLHVSAKEESWVSIAADGKTVFAGTLPASGERTVTAQSRIFVRAGNIGGLNFAFNGKPLPPQGALDEVKNLSFGPEGLLSSTAPKPAADTQ